MATCGVYGPFSAGLSLLTTCDPGRASAWLVVAKSRGLLSSGTYSGLNPSSVLVLTFMPSLTAVARMYGLNEEPTCSRLSAMFSWQWIFSQYFALMTLPVPLYL